MCVSVSHQDRLEDMECFHSYVCLCIICLDRYWERFRQMTHTSPGLGNGRAPLMTCIFNKPHYSTHNALQTNGSTALKFNQDTFIAQVTVILFYFFYFLCNSPFCFFGCISAIALSVFFGGLSATQCHSPFFIFEGL